MPSKLNRRQFLIRAAAGAGAATLACGGLTFAALRAPEIPLSEKLSSGENTMDKKILVAYATRTGSTIEIAQAVGQELTNRGFAVDVRPIKQVTDLTGYSAVVVGSAVRFGQWLPEAVKFIEQNRGVMSKVPTAVFAVHILNTADDEASRKARLLYLDPIRKLVTPAAEAFFAGVGDPMKVSFIERIIGKMVKSPEGDFRDWTAIRGWAQALPL